MTDIYGAGADAAVDILRDVYRIPVEKALNPLRARDFLVIVNRLGRELKKTAGPIELKAVDLAIKRLDVDWVGIKAGDRAEVIRRATEALGGAGRLIVPRVSKVFDVRSEPLVRDTKRASVRKFRLGIGVSLSETDKRIAKFAAESQANFVRDEFGVKQGLFSERARVVVGDGLEKGLGSKEIASNLDKALRKPTLNRSRSYWENIATIFSNRARTFTQLSAFGEAGVERYRFEAVLDEVTSNICRHLHEKEFSVRKGMDRIKDVENLRDPEKIRDLQPFVSDGVDDGNQIMYYKRGGRRVQVARVLESGVGEADKIGRFSQTKAPEQLENVGISMPPLHGRCRSTVVTV